MRGAEEEEGGVRSRWRRRGEERAEETRELRTRCHFGLSELSL